MKISEELQKRGYEALRPYNSTSIFMNKIGETNNDNVIEIKGKELIGKNKEQTLELVLSKIPSYTVGNTNNFNKIIT